MKIESLDHLVLTVKNIEHSSKFYIEVLGMEKEIFGTNRVALKFGHQKINLHERGKEFEPKAARATAGSADLCFIIKSDLLEAMKHVNSFGVEIISGPLPRNGAKGAINSFYFRDPDGNLIEISSYGK